MNYPKLYTTTSGLKTILSSPQYKLLSKVVFDWFDVMTPLDLNAIAELESDEYLWPLVLSRLNSAANGTRQIGDMKLDSATYVRNQSVDDISSDYFISSESPEDCEKLRNQTGIFVVSDQDISPLEVLFQFVNDLPDAGTLYTANSTIGTQDGWDQALNGYYPFNAKAFPTNAAVIYDKYIFASSVQIVGKRLAGLCNAMISPQLKERFQLTIVTSQKDTRDLQRLPIMNPQDFFSTLKSKIENGLQRKIDLQIVFHDSTGLCKGFHDRYIHTAYYTLYSGYGYSPFDNGNPASLFHRTTFTFQGNFAFLKLQNNRGGLHFAQANHNIICAEKRRFINWQAGSTVPNTPYYFGDCENRLFYNF